MKLSDSCSRILDDCFVVLGDTDGYIRQPLLALFLSSLRSLSVALQSLANGARLQRRELVQALEEMPIDDSQHADEESIYLSELIQGAVRASLGVDPTSGCPNINVDALQHAVEPLVASISAPQRKKMWEKYISLSVSSIALHTTVELLKELRRRTSFTAPQLLRTVLSAMRRSSSSFLAAALCSLPVVLPVEDSTVVGIVVGVLRAPLEKTSAAVPINEMPSSKSAIDPVDLDRRHSDIISRLNELQRANDELLESKRTAYDTSIRDLNALEDRHMLLLRSALKTFLSNPDHDFSQEAVQIPSADRQLTPTNKNSRPSTLLRTRPIHSVTPELYEANRTFSVPPELPRDEDWTLPSSVHPTQHVTVTPLQHCGHQDRVRRKVFSTVASSRAVLQTNPSPLLHNPAERGSVQHILDHIYVPNIEGRR